MASTSPSRERLLAAAVDQAMNGGIADLSLRELAAAIGTSHRMLLYHFGSREGLIAAVAKAVDEADRANLLSWGTTAGDARRCWQRISDPQWWPMERLFFELYVHALLRRPGTENVLGNGVEPWVAPIAAAFARAGADQATARAEARLGLAVVRGLLLDLLATGDREGVTGAYERFLRHHGTAEPGPPS